nr:MAG TPA: hypothetical protein [Caudoviricetes sp.]
MSIHTHLSAALHTQVSSSSLASYACVMQCPSSYTLRGQAADGSHL